MEKIKTAVVTGWHGYDVIGFQTMFRQIPDIDFYPQSLEDYAADRGNGRPAYEVVVFYHAYNFMPGVEPEPLAAPVKAPLEEVVARGQGLLVLHHALLAFRKWQFWSNICGIQDRSFTYDRNQSVTVEIANPHHPITRGLAPWEMVDETYGMQNAGADSDILLTTRHPKSMRTLAWTREYQGSRVFCCQPGHDNLVFSNPHFRTLLGQAIQWLARRI